MADPTLRTDILHNRMNALTHVFIGKTDDGARANAWVLVDGGFDFRGIDVDTSGHDHVRLAVDQVIKWDFASLDGAMAKAPKGGATQGGTRRTGGSSA